MATDFFDFEADTIGALPSGWIETWSTSGTFSVQSLSGSQVYEYDASGNSSFARAASICTALSTAVDLKMAGEFTLTNTLNNNIGLLALRANNAVTGSRQGYSLFIRDNLTLNRTIAGSDSSIATASKTFALNTKYKYRFEATGTSPVNLKVKIWEAASSEPGTWDIDHNDSDASRITTAGYAAVGGLGVDTYSFDNIGIGTDGDAAPGSGPSLSSVPATAYPSQSRTVTGTGFGATQGTGGLTIGGVTQTITSWSDTEIIFTTVLGTNNYGTGKTLEVTTDAATTVSDTIELVADTANGFGYVDMSSPNTSDESSVAFGATPTVVTGDQFEWEDFNNLGNLTVDAQGFVTNVDTEGTFRGRFWDATDSTWGAVETFEASVPGEEDTWPFGKGINPAATKNWTWGRRHPKTNMRVRIYK